MARRPHLSRRVRDAIRAGAQSSAVVLADLVVERFAPSSVVDVGCGEGWLVHELRSRNVKAFGVDGDDVGADLVLDLTAPPYPELDGAPFDLAVCLEVAEHVDEANAGDLVGWLCDLAPVVAFSAAIPGQGGQGHVNERPPAYWVDLFAQRGLAGSGALRTELWDDERIEAWYRQNLLVFADPKVLKRVGLDQDGCPYIVHPGIWSVYR